MNAIGALICLALMLVIFTGSRLAALLAIIAGVMFLTEVQAIPVLGLNIFAVRFLELAGFVRVMARREFVFKNLNKIDRTFLILYIFVPIVYCLRATEGQAYTIGASVDAYLCYFTFRGLVRDLEDFRKFLRVFIFLLAPYALMVIFESATHRNAFAYVGGGMFDWSRGDRFRCVGSFRNPDLLGTLGLSFIPLYVGLACSRPERIRSAIGIVLCLIIVWASNSGGPLCATAVGFAGWGLWFMRTRMQLVRRIMVVMLIAIGMMMDAPIWYLLARISQITGGDGWHRSYLIDVSMQHIKLWWFAGMPIIDTSDWFPYSLVTGADITNNFISFALNAGLGAMALLILLLVMGFSSIGKSLKQVRSSPDEPKETEFMLWGFGAVLAAHIANWLGVTYFDQSYVLWFMELAAISSICNNYIPNPLSEIIPVHSSADETAKAEPARQFEHEAH